MTNSPPSGSDTLTNFDRLHPEIRRWIWEQKWEELRDVQDRAISAVLGDDGDVLIAAATAAGKTEAAFLPVLTAVADREDRGFSVLYVSPLKALINDQFRRLDQLCERLEIETVRWHGDAPQSAKDRARKNPRGAILITPESIEAMLIRRPGDALKMLGALDFIVIDELHAFMKGPRGLHLSSLLRRLDALTGRRARRIGLSATIGDLNKAAAWMNPEQPETVSIVESTSDAPELRLQIRAYYDPVDVDDTDGLEIDGKPIALDYIADHIFKNLRGSNNLVFAGSRRRVESLADRLRARSEKADVPNEFYPHHGSLSKELREELEARLKKAELPTTGVATTTLELGIDIGSVTSVAQIGAPRSIASLRQRLGRSGRRRGMPAVLRIYVRERNVGLDSDPLDRLRFEVVRAVASVRLMIEKFVEPPVAETAIATVVLHQTLSLITQLGGARADRLYAMACGAGPLSAFAKTDYVALLRAMATPELALIEQAPDGTIMLGKEGERLTAARDFYAIFATDQEWKLITGGRTLGTITESSPSLVRVEISSAEEFEKHKSGLSVGQYLLVASGNNRHLLATITAVRATHVERRATGASADADGEEHTNGSSGVFRFQIDTQPIGTLSEDGEFSRGSHSLPVPTEHAYVTPASVLEGIFSQQIKSPFPLGTLSIAPDVKLEIDGDRFFSKHVAVVGSTGSGKSCAVAKILQTVVGIESKANANKASQKNSHIVIFDIHAEYAAAFKLEETEAFTLNLLDVDNLRLPYWLMNAQELEEIFIESNEQNSHNQISQFRHAVVRNKCRHNPTLTNVSFDTPIYFSIDEVVTYLENMNIEVVGKLPGEGKPKLADETLVTDRDELYFDKLQSFVVSSTAAATKASNGPFNGEFDRLILRLRTRLADPRLQFLFYPKKENGTDLSTDDFADVVRQFVGYITKSNVSIVDLSGIPFEVLSIVVSLISRMIFDFGFHYSKNRHVGGAVSDVPILVVCEEAHNYVPRSGGAAYDASRKSIERIAKEGRKYGVTLMVVSQRPSEVSETIFSQCSNFISLRLTNAVDQACVKSLLPDLSAGVGDLLPNLGQGEFLIVGDAPLMPTVGHFALPVPEPHSRSVNYLQEWNSDWRHVDFNGVIDRWRGKVLAKLA